MAVQTKPISVVKVAVMLAVVLALPLLPLLVSRRWDWWEAWAYAGVWVVGFGVSRGLAARRHPDLLAERARALEHENTKGWDRVLGPVVALGTALAPLAAGLEAVWGERPVFGAAVKWAALALIVAGYALGTYALMENRFFSGTVRIQSERGHTVVSSGPYRWVRHPGYVGVLLTCAGVPLWLESWWAMGAALLLAAAVVARTALEDRTLQAELAGYQAYAARVRWRLVPGVW